MKLKTIAEMRDLLKQAGVATNDEGVAVGHQVATVQAPVPVPSAVPSELLSAIRELTAATKERPAPVVVQPAASEQPRRWVFKAKYGMDMQLIEIVAEAQ